MGALVCGILSLLCGIAGLFLITLPLALVLGIVSIVLGVMGVRRAARSGIGRGQAIAGIVTGSLGLVAMLLWAALFLSFFPAMVDEFGNPLEDPEGFQERFEEEQEP